MTAALGLVLISLSGPRLVAAILNLPGDATKSAYLASVHEGATPLGGDDLERWQASRRAALEFVQDAQSWADLANIEAIRSVRFTGDSARAHRLASREAMQRAVSLSPTNGFFWLRLALMEHRLAAPATTVLGAVRASIDVAPYEPNALERRLWLVFTYWSEADDALRKNALQQARFFVPARSTASLFRLAQAFPERIDDLFLAVGDSRPALRVLNKAAEQVVSSPPQQ